MKKAKLKSLISFGIAAAFSLSVAVSAFAMESMGGTSKPTPKPAAKSTVKTTPKPAAKSTVKTTPKPTPKPVAKTYTGYLMDAHCAKTGVDDETGKVNVKKNPEKHTTSCLKIDMCMMEGLGIMVKQSNGTYAFYKFDKAGSKKADDQIMMKTKRKFGNKITVTGKLSGTTLTISSIKEAK